MNREENPFFVEDSGSINEDSPLLLNKQDSNYYLPDVIRLNETFLYMKLRQWQRNVKGMYSKPKVFNFYFLILYLIIYGTYLYYQLKVRNMKIDSILEYILMGFISIIMGWISPSSSWLTRIILFESYGFFYFFFIMGMYSKPELYVPLGASTLGAMFITMVNYFFYPTVHRSLNACVGKGKNTWKLEPTEESENAPNGKGFRLVKKAKNNLFSPEYQCVYEGHLNERGRPSGLGSWMDTSFTGEHLFGYWENGIPIGPFESQENDTHNMLVNLRIIYASNAGGRWNLKSQPLRTGVASIETCVSGGFFKGYPLVHHLEESVTVCRCSTRFGSCECIRDIFGNKFFRHIDDDKHIKSVTVSVDDRFNVLHVTGHRSRTRKPKNVNIELSRDVDKYGGEIVSLGLDDNWNFSPDNEGLLFIHGINHTLDDALKRMGQLLALGHFPPYIKPFVYNWPSSTNPLLYNKAKTRAADPEQHRDLARFLGALFNSGIRKLHVMCHSMGTRFFLNAFPLISDLLSRNETIYASSGNLRELESNSRVLNYEQISIQNLILLNPDYEVVKFQADFNELQHFVEHVTIYADERDVALKLSRQVNGSYSLGLGAKKVTRVGGCGEGPNKYFGDMDIVDTKDLDRNMNSQFHGYFNINRMMVDDLREVIVTGRRASERTSRLKSSGITGMYRFILVPPSVVMV
eukprot:TRINITY_DN817_c0_g1_i1.p1 TRINITY_DN817_c0_g1~~TRINITY_DN817_c0_g1_i1.p1  ORF type:complete len:691 (-),score=121.23 TRINITY_DN817_c0_g1_i1:24-2096(-)